MRFEVVVVLAVLWGLIPVIVLLLADDSNGKDF